MGQTPITRRSDLLNLHTQMCEAARVLMKTKNADYADEDAPFANFESVEAIFRGKITASQDIITRMAEKVCRLATASMRPLVVQDETALATCHDIINYVVLFIGERSSHLPPSKPERGILRPPSATFTGGEDSGLEGV